MSPKNILSVLTIIIIILILIFLPRNNNNNNYEKIIFEEEIISTPVPTETIKIPVSGEFVLPKGIEEKNGAETN